jgi:hypothetical protein
VVDDPGFNELLEYTHHGNESLDVPSSTTIKRRVLDRTDEAVVAQKAIFEVSTCFFFVFCVRALMRVIGP